MQSSHKILERCENTPYCQNYKISHQKFGKECSVHRLVEIIKELEHLGAYNINFVTPTHFSDQIIEALKSYKPKVPVVWNTGGYETEEQIERLRGYVDIFLIDLKYYSLSAPLTKSMCVFLSSRFLFCLTPLILVLP